VRNTYSRVRGLLAAVLAVTAIAVPAISAVPASAAVQLSFWSWRPEDKAFYDTQAAKFTAANPGISIKFTPYLNTDYNAILSTALIAGKGPDILQLRAYGAGAGLSDAGYLMPLTTKELPALAKIPAGIVSGTRGFTNKAIFGLPYSISALGIMYNPKLLAKAGITELPTTWKSFLSALTKVKNKGILPLGNGGGNGPALEQLWGAIGPTFYGGTDFYNGVTAGTKTFSDKKFVASLQAVKDLTPYMPAGYEGLTYDAARALFANEKAAFYIGGNFEIGYFKSLNKDLQLGWFPAPAATQDSPKYVSSWADGGFAINAKTAHKVEALKFLNFLSSKPFGQAILDQLAFISTTPRTVIKDPAVKAINKGIQQFGTPYLMLVGFRYMTPTGSAILQSGFQNLIVGKTTPEQLAKDVQAGIASWYKPQAGNS
jgi:raffinose/stachyose/melibiose transport system substrate-binding protein